MAGKCGAVCVCARVSDICQRPLNARVCLQVYTHCASQCLGCFFKRSLQDRPGRPLIYSHARFPPPAQNAIVTCVNSPRRSQHLRGGRETGQEKSILGEFRNLTCYVSAEFLKTKIALDTFFFKCNGNK